MRQTSKRGQNFSRWDLEEAWQGNFGHNRKARNQNQSVCWVIRIGRGETAKKVEVDSGSQTESIFAVDSILARGLLCACLRAG